MLFLPHITQVCHHYPRPGSDVGVCSINGAWVWRPGGVRSTLELEFNALHLNLRRRDLFRSGTEYSVLFNMYDLFIYLFNVHVIEFYLHLCVCLTSNFHFRLFLHFQAVVVVLFFQFSTGKDYYELLDVPKNANDREIRKAFKRLAVTMHPDKNQVCLRYDRDIRKRMWLQILWQVLGIQKPILGIFHTWCSGQYLIRNKITWNGFFFFDSCLLSDVWHGCTNS